MAAIILDIAIAMVTLMGMGMNTSTIIKIKKIKDPRRLQICYFLLQVVKFKHS